MDAVTLALAKKIPVFDLAEMGLPAVAIGSEEAVVTNTTQIKNAIRKSVVKFCFKVNVGAETYFELVSGGAYIEFNGACQVSTRLQFGPAVYDVFIVVSDDAVFVKAGELT